MKSAPHQNTESGTYQSSDSFTQTVSQTIYPYLGSISLFIMVTGIVSDPLLHLFGFLFFKNHFKSKNNNKGGERKKIPLSHQALYAAMSLSMIGGLYNGLKKEKNLLDNNKNTKNKQIILKGSNSDAVKLMLISNLIYNFK